jgi:hypothetical protein
VFSSTRNIYIDLYKVFSKMFQSTRRGAVTVSLSWVFMIVIGAFFLLFAYTIIDTYTENEERLFQLQLEQSLQSVFQLVGRSSGLEENSFDSLQGLLSEREVDLLCTDSFALLSIDGSLDSTNQFLQNYPTLMTRMDLGSADESFLAVENFRMPFKITNLLGIVSKKNLVVIDLEAEFSDLLLDRLDKSSFRELNYIGENFSSLATFPSRVENRALDSIVFVSDENLTSFPFDEYDEQVILLQVERENQHVGSLTFQEESGFSRSYPYVDFRGDLSIVSMAMLSDSESFSCAYALLEDSLVPVSRFYLEKAEFLHNKSKSELLCSSSVLIPGASGTDEFLQQSIRYELVRDSLEALHNTLSTEALNNSSQVYNLAFDLNEKHNGLKSANCELVY